MVSVEAEGSDGVLWSALQVVTFTVTALPSSVAVSKVAMVARVIATPVRYHWWDRLSGLGNHVGGRDTVWPTDLVPPIVGDGWVMNVARITAEVAEDVRLRRRVLAPFMVTDAPCESPLGVRAPRRRPAAAEGRRRWVYPQAEPGFRVRPVAVVSTGSSGWPSLSWVGDQSVAARWGPVAVAMLGLVSGWDFWVPGLWTDEVATVIAARRSWASLFRMLGSVDAVHGFYYVIMHAWFRVVGYSPFTLRLPSLLAVVATAVVLVLIGRHLWTPSAGVVAGVVFLAIPRTVWMAGEGRSFAPATLAVTLSVYFLIRALALDGRWWLGFAAASTLSVWLFMYSILLLPVLLLVAMLHRPAPAQRRRLWLAVGVAVSTSLPLVLFSLTQHKQISWIEKTTPDMALAAPPDAFFEHGGSSEPVWLGLSLVCLVIFVISWLRGRLGAKALSSRSTGVLVLGWLTLPLTILLSLNATIPVFHPRYLSNSAPALALLVAGAVLVACPHRWQTLAVLIGCGVLAVAPVLEQRLPASKDRLLDVAEFVEGQRESGDAVWFHGTQGSRSSRMARYAYPDAFAGMQDLTLDQSYEDTGRLLETDVPLAAASHRLEGVDRIIGIVYTYRNPPELASCELVLLRQKGFAIRSDARLGAWRVLVLERG